MDRQRVRNGRTAAWIVTALVIAVSPGLQAADGVLEINEACVLAGCFSGDAPGYPVETKENLSYRLTGDLFADGKDAIILAPRASLDLGGFTISGGYTETGILVYAGASVSHGTIRRFLTAIEGVNSGASDVRVDDMHLLDGGYLGRAITAYERWRIADSFLIGNWDGCTLYGDAVLRGNVISNSSGDGVRINSGDVLLLDNLVTNNGTYGVRTTATGRATLGRNLLNGNFPTSGGAQISGPFLQIAPNVCGADLSCP